MWSINLLFYVYSMSSKDIKAKIILLISRFATLENKDFYVQNDYGILAYMCINEVMEYWWLETGAMSAGIKIGSNIQICQITMV